MELRTERLVLRDLVHDDWRSIALFYLDPAVTRFLLRHQKSEEYVRRFVDAAAASAVDEFRYSFRFAITLPEDGRLIGTCTLFRPSREDRTAVVGFEMDPNYWGRGFATEAVARVIAFGFETQQIARCEASCFAANRASRRVMEKVGMQERQSSWWFPWFLPFHYREFRPIVQYALDRCDRQSTLDVR